MWFWNLNHTNVERSMCSPHGLTEVFLQRATLVHATTANRGAVNEVQTVHISRGVNPSFYSRIGVGSKKKVTSSAGAKYSCLLQPQEIESSFGKERPGHCKPLTWTMSWALLAFTALDIPFQVGQRPKFVGHDLSSFG
eukprot:320043-Amphidinium_carterae.1